MRSLPKPLRLALWVALAVAMALLPPWEMCWHADGTACAQTSERCCDEPGPPSSTASCPECFDLAPSPALRSIGTGPGAPLPAPEIGTVPPLAGVTAARPRAHGDGIHTFPQSPPAALIRPIRC